MALIAVGTHEGVLVGWQSQVEGGLSLELAFAFKAHASSIQCLLASGKQLLCGCADGAIEVFDARSRSSVGTLLEHKYGVSAMAAHGQHLLTGDSSGALVVWRCHDWTPVAHLKGHARTINSIAIHPSGRVALTVGDDCLLILWDLVKGAQAFAQKLAKPARSVSWVGAAGESYDLVYDDEVARHDGSNGARQSGASLSPGEPRIRCSANLQVGTAKSMLVGLEGGALRLLRSGASAAAGGEATVAAHAKRVRAMEAFEGPASEGAPTTPWIVTAGGDGLVKLWSARSIEAALSGAAAAEPAGVLTSAKGFRITSVAVVRPGGSKGVKRQREKEAVEVVAQSAAQAKGGKSAPTAVAAAKAAPLTAEAEEAEEEEKAIAPSRALMRKKEKRVSFPLSGEVEAPKGGTDGGHKGVKMKKKRTQ
jgi:protein MAK11